jgi:hypothetical protein
VTCNFWAQTFDELSLAQIILFWFRGLLEEGKFRPMHINRWRDCNRKLESQFTISSPLFSSNLAPILTMDNPKFLMSITFSLISISTIRTYIYIYIPLSSCSSWNVEMVLMESLYRGLLAFYGINKAEFCLVCRGGFKGLRSVSFNFMNVTC